MPQRLHHDSPFHFYALCLLMILGVFVRFYGLRDWALSPDDISHLRYGLEKTMGDVIRSVLKNGQNHPFTFFLIPHWMLKVSHNHLWLLCVGIVPGLFLIPLFYRLGEEAVSKNAGLFMAYIATFGVHFVGTEQAIRQYPLMLVFETLALIQVFRFDKTQRLRALWLYGVWMALAICMQFSVVIAIFTVGCVKGAWWCVKDWRANRKALFVWTLVHALLAGVFLFFYKFQLSQEICQLDFEINRIYTASKSFSAACLLDNLIDFLINVYAPFWEQFWGPIAALMLLFPFIHRFKTLQQHIPFTSTVFYQFGQLYVVLIVLLIIAASLSLLQFVPLEGSRRGLYVAPFVLLVYGVQADFLIYIYKKYLAKHISPKGFKIRKIVHTTAAILLPLTFYVWPAQPSKEECQGSFRLDKSDRQQSIQTLFKVVTEDDIVITNLNALHTVIELDDYSPQNIATITEQLDYWPKLLRTPLDQVILDKRRFVFRHLVQNPAFGLSLSYSEFIALVRSVLDHVDLKPNARVFFLDLQYISIPTVIFTPNANNKNDFLSVSSDDFKDMLWFPVHLKQIFLDNALRKAWQEKGRVHFHDKEKNRVRLLVSYSVQDLKELIKMYPSV